jgi:tRNA(fMet)-specific endonuclease VapC
MKYLLDTNTCIRYINGSSQSVADKLNALDKRDAVVCSVVKAELFFGALRSQNPIKTMAGQRQFLSLFVSLPFDDAAAEHYAQIRAELSQKGTPIGSNDLLIAAIALANGLTLITHNTSEFGRVSGLKIEDWETDQI